MCSQSSPVRVLLAIPESLLRRGLSVCLDDAPGVAVVGEVSGILQALDCLGRCSPDIVILSSGVGNFGVLGRFCNELRRRDAVCFPVLLVAEEDRNIVLAAAKAGVRGLLHIGYSSEEIQAVIRLVSSGQAGFSAGALARIAEDYLGIQRETAASETPPLTDAARQAGQSQLKSGTKGDRLSKRERQVLAYVAAGNTSREIATQLGIAPRTVEAHRARVSSKLGIRTIAGLTRFALKTGLSVGGSDD